MKTIIFLFLLSVLMISSAQAQTVYYIGQAVLTKVDTGVVTRSPYIIARTSDPVSGTIHEEVVSLQNNKFVKNTSLLTIKDNHFRMSESTGTVTGEGDLTGEPWKWTFLRAEFFYVTENFKLRIVDFNFFTDPNAISGHKDFYLIQGSESEEKLFQQEDVVVYPTDKAIFEAKQRELLGIDLD